MHADASWQERGAHILEALPGRVSVPNRTFVYRISLAAVAAVMVLLPLVYVGIVGAVAWAVAWHARHHAWLFFSAHLGRLVYFTPIVAGLVLVFFMSKPLLHRHQESRRRYTVGREKEPLLAAFVDRVCASVGAPAPVRIDLDDRANASASLGDGWRGFVRGDVVLTVGLPLAAGLTLRQFAGVLAHEFGHFTQRAGMRFRNVISAVNLWFARVVYERDAWDVRLQAGLTGGPYLLLPALWLAQAAVHATRFVLQVLMLVGQAVSCLLMRQMEYDADRCECALTGSDGFEATQRRVIELSVARQLVQGELGQIVNQRALPDDLPMLVARRLETAGPSVGAAVDRMAAADTTGGFDTHPAPAQRARAARALQFPGVLHLEEPATVLFGDFPARSRHFTRVYYEQDLGVPADATILVPTSHQLSELAVKDGLKNAVERFFGAAGVVRLLPLTAGDPAAEPDRGAAARRDLADARRRMEELSDGAKRASERCTRMAMTIRIVLLTEHLARAGVSVKLADVGVTEVDLRARSHDSEALARARARLENELRIARHALDPFRQAATERLQAAIRLSAAGSAAETSEEPAHRAHDVAALVGIVNAISAHGDELWAAAEQCLVAAALTGHGPGGPVPDVLAAERVAREGASVARSARSTASQLLELMDDVPPLPGDSHASLAESVTDGVEWSVDDAPIEQVQLLMERLSDVHGRAVAQLVRLVEEVEQAQGIGRGAAPVGQASA